MSNASTQPVLDALALAEDELKHILIKWACKDYIPTPEYKQMVQESVAKITAALNGTQYEGERHHLETITF